MSGAFDEDPLIGRTVAEGRYEVLSLLGRGGMGIVYRARQHPLERLVALKLIHRELAMQPTVRERFHREMRATAAVEHPNTVRLYDFGEIDGQPFLAMEYLEGATLREVLGREGALPSARLIPIALQIAKALRAAHAVGIIHRDLKPDNVMLLSRLGEPDFVKVLDFGIARPLENSSGYRTAAGALVGTPEYMSPEQASGAPVDARSDLYMLGVMLYELAAGAPPFVNRSITALLLAHVRDPPPPLRAGAGPLPAALEVLIGRLLAKSPQARPAAAEEVMDELSRMAPAVSATPPTAAAETGVAGGIQAGGTRLLEDGPGTESSGAVAGATKQLPAAGTSLAHPHTAGGAARAQRTPAPARPWIVATIVLGLAGAPAAVWLRRGHPSADDARAERGQAALAALLDAPGEPPWPAACRTRDPAVVVKLYAAAIEIAAAASDSERQRAAGGFRGLEPAPEAALASARILAGTDAAAALSGARRAVALCPASAVARNLEGNALQKLQQLEPAQATYGEAMRLAPRYIAPRFNLGLLDLRAGRAPQALAAFDQIARATPDYPNIFLVRAEAHRRAHDDVAALADLEEQVRRHPDSADGWFHLGQALAERDRERSNSALCRAGTLGHREAAALCRADPITGSGDPGRARPTENRVGP